MESMDHRTEHRLPGREPKTIQAVLHHDVQMLGASDQRFSDCGGWTLVEVLLTGGAPWGFTLRGGREHQEPLLITKVEENSLAAAVKLQVGDEIVTINEIPLSGYRQEAICLVKGSYKTLSLVVRRRSDPVGRPHSWHSSKFTEAQPEAVTAQPTPTPAWHARHSTSPQELSACWDQTNLRRVSDQFSSLGSMDSLEQSSHPFLSGRLSLAKSSSSVDHLGMSGGGSKRDSAYSSYSTGSGTPDYTLSRSTENALHKVGQWDSGGRVGRNSYGLLEGGHPDERPFHLAVPLGPEGHEGPRADEPPGSRSSSSSRSSIAPVWHVPEKKKATAPSPPPPLPPMRSDSFAVTKVHEKGLAVPYSEAPAHPTQQRVPGRAVDRDRGMGEGHDGTHRGPRPHERGSEVQKSSNLLKPDTFYSHANPDVYGNSGSQVTSNKLYSLSSSDVRLGQQGYFHTPYHPRQYSDESALYPQARTPSAQWQQSTSGCYSSMQELSFSGQAQAGVPGMATDRLPEGGGHSRFYCVTARQGAPQSLLGRAEGWMAEDVAQSVAGDRESVSSQKAGRARAQQQENPEVQDGSWDYRPEDMRDVLGEDRGGQRRSNGYTAEGHYMACSPSSYNEEKKRQECQPETWPPPEDAATRLQRTPILHSQENTGPEAPDPVLGKQAKHNDRYATTLRNEIQLKRAQLQKSKSAATLSAASEAPGDTEPWEASCTQAAPCDGSFSSTYKDNLKEAQARVLRATSFRRRDLEPVLPEHAGPEPVPGYVVPGPARRDSGPEPVQSRTASGPVSRIGGRKRFPPEKKVRSFSEPDKINEVGVEEDVPPQEPPESFEDRRRVFEAMGGSAAPRSGTNKAQPPSAADGPAEIQHAGRHPDGTHGSPRHTDSQAVLEKQRLGTFAEYEATWNGQRKPTEARVTGRYRSAENILDSGLEERGMGSYVHERSQSSPSADFYGQDTSAVGRKSAGGPQPEEEPASQESATQRLFDRERHSSAPEGEHRGGDPSHHQHSLQDTEPPPLPPALKKKGSLPQRPLPPQLDKHWHPEAASSAGETQESPPVPLGSCSVRPYSAEEATSPGPEHAPSSSSGKDSQQGTRHEDEQGAGQGASPSQPEPAPPPPAAISSSSSSSSSHKEAALLKPSMEGFRSLSPQFAPQRLTDRPPVSLQDDASSRMENAVEGGATVKKVPIKIVHAESSSEKETRRFLMPSEVAPVAGGPGAPDSPPLGPRGPSELSYSPFCAYTRQKDNQPQMEPKWEEPADAGPPGAPQEGSHNGGPPDGPLEEDRKREELTRDIVGRDKSLADILNQTKMKTTMDLMEGIFPQGEQLVEEAQQRRKVAPKQAPRRSAEERQDEDSLVAAVPMVTSSSYYSTSAPKAELLIKMKDMQEEIQEQDSEDELDVDLANKKHELIDSLSKKLAVLRDARESLQEDVQANNVLGEEVELTVQHVCKPNELDKFRMFVGDLDKVVSLLLSLSGRLARVENALNSLEEGAAAEEKRTLEEKRKLLIRQHDDAKELKENLDRRESVVYNILANCLSEEHLADYEHFVKMKSALIIEQRKLEDKIKLGEEQLKCLTDSLPLEQRRPF
ncbi:protein Shroom2-like isoform X2 [Brienomyrus brachyistius]|uniref:protein Shroom2-like isoform X2 n=1 Tax=Brienomyrus brachyistius TaxID=42636 RepID=UPI0020B3D760|nr:protein Shroom2-like isoform X2 [Brienomyrus brachyistius]